MRVTVLLIMLGRALDSISRRVSVSLVNRDMISPWVRLSKYLRGSFSRCSNISHRISQRTRVFMRMSRKLTP